MQVNFFNTKEFNNLFDELKECDIEDAIDIIQDINDAKNDFDVQLPEWYKIRWSSKWMIDPDTFKQNYNIYFKELYNLDL